MTHPYETLPEWAFWRQAVVRTPQSSLDPVVNPKFVIAGQDRVATAGSCFAQHIARHLTISGFNYYITETAHPLCQEDIAKAYHYGVYSARYGNIYTSRQLLQLIKRCLGTFVPNESAWLRRERGYVDPFRPQIAPDGYATQAELQRDREHHLRCVQAMFLGLDVFIFTLGLTEGWKSKDDGAVYPVCPGVSGGEFDGQKYEFFNLRVSEVVSDLVEFRHLLRAINPKAKIILTTSPVPLVATAVGRHVLVSTTASKAILRSACDEMLVYEDVEYFPSFEIVTGNYAKGQYFASDLRSVTEEGVSHVMRVFLQRMTTLPNGPPAAVADALAEFRPEAITDTVRVICEEEALAWVSQNPADS